jgi:uncharacterized 2Fe-2S/4Fe-4S cluster protein (DUF4445 family)
MKNYKVEFLPVGTIFTAEKGTALKDVINKAGIDFDFPCGGRGKCGKCRVRITAGASAPTEKEVASLTTEEISAGIRFACLTEVSMDTTVELLSDKNQEHQILLTSLNRAVTIEPHIRKRYLEPDKPSMTDNRADWGRVKDNLLEQGHVTEEVSASIAILRALPEVLRRKRFKVTALCYNDEILGLEAGDTTGVLLGMAFDIGTTTIVGYLMDLYTGSELAVASMLNPQTRYGGDVISRITHANHTGEGLEDLHAAVTGAVNQLIGQAAKEAAVKRDDIYAISIVGNTCMHHLFLGINPWQVAVSPYVPVVSDPLVVDATSVRLDINQAGKVFVLPNIAGFVGADTVAVLLATEMDRSEKIKLVIDIGTNGEIALGSKDGLVACSAAAGPAFEGAQISCGMRGATGAIDHVTFGKELDFTVIGDTSPLGVCGSALLDSVAGLLEVGIISDKGKFIEPENITHPIGQRLKDRIVRHNNLWAFLLSEEGGKKIMITQKDVRELQLAKGAMAAAIAILMKAKGVGPEDIDEVLLAGAFGNYLDPHSTCAIGLIPQELEGKINMVGNAAGSGSKLALMSAGELLRAKQLVENVEFIELATDRDFTNIFATSMLFPKQSH